jgi:7-carboxy-7-deazaguanine synthase (Cx14CxxC type)
MVSQHVASKLLDKVCTGVTWKSEVAISEHTRLDFVGTDGNQGGKYADAAELAAKINAQWPADVPNHKYVVCTGGEPLLQLDEALIHALHGFGFEVAIETNGTLPVPQGVDWICVSPKMGAELVVKSGHEIKVVVPQVAQQLAAYTDLDFQHFFVQAMDGPEAEKNIKLAIELCKNTPQWRLSLQTHKLLQIP